MSNIRLVVQDDKIRTTRWKYKFTQESADSDKKSIFGDDFGEKDGHLGYFGHLSIATEKSLYKGKSTSSENVPEVSKVTKNDFTDEELGLAGLSREELE